ncbi:lipoic acid synthetase [Thermocrinis albus DSM 14484]|uniref:Lipoyl synthase n=1 Tax=Thermocrinis albus (strain DSM 14484 / JCM 11386 / HI 11/12) TaxID=638303 RepID=D3SLS3_THEAH|nr:lipoyl synthase [Thermocrinis albus]ADC89703.1 lipoic acid synthetase [Thermocrinis albus DSM 14484]
MKPVVHLSQTHSLKRILRKALLHTVCEESRCPNISECFSRGTATFMILGDVCTRSCSFCNVRRGKEGTKVDPDEAMRLLHVVRQLNLKYVVITSPTRDDLVDGGASQFALCTRILKEGIPGIKVEALVPDMGGSVEALRIVLDAKPDVLAHNVETVPRLYNYVRKGSDYIRSLRLLENVKKLSGDITTKSAIILGFGERWDEILQVMKDLRNAGCDVLTIGQYYQPSRRHHPVLKYYTKEEFEALKEEALSLGFKWVASGPNVRSSYRAFEVLHSINIPSP